jgi:hypothetical protein
LQVYITGHGGDGFMKFQDKEEVTSDEIGKAFALVSTQLSFLPAWPYFIACSSETLGKPEWSRSDLPAPMHDHKFMLHCRCMSKISTTSFCS